MSKPIFKHHYDPSLDSPEFLGHWAGYDVYRSWENGYGGTTLIARSGDEPSACTRHLESSLIQELAFHFRPQAYYISRGYAGEKSAPIPSWCVFPVREPWLRAMYAALLYRGLDLLPNYERS